MNSDFIKQVQSNWNKLQPHERLMLTVMAAFIVVFLLYVLFWLPVTKELRNLRTSVPRAEAALAVMRVQAAKIKTLQNSKSSNSNKGGILSNLEQTATQKGLRQHITKIEPDGENGVRFTVEGASLNNLLSFLASMHQNSGLRVENASISPVSESPGTVNARIVLRGLAT